MNKILFAALMLGSAAPQKEKPHPPMGLQVCVPIYSGDQEPAAEGISQPKDIT